MAHKVISRRHRKVNLKAKLPVHVGSFDVLYDDQNETAAPGTREHTAAAKDRQGVETGVDKEEEGEVHLQNAISASAAALSTRASGGRAAAHSGPAASSSKSAAGPFIPTPDATGTVSDYAELYPQRAFAEPSTLIRFSDTVEDVIGVAYCLDREDAAFLQRYNGQVAGDRVNGTGAAGSAAAGDRQPRSPRKDKGKEVASSNPAILTEDNFELIMDLYERYTDEHSPLLHLDLSRIPRMEEFAALFHAPENAHMAHLHMFTHLVYVHWKERRIKRGGKCIIPQLDYDESREDNPYVCFRRREAKVARKTRRSETNNIERLVRLRVDLSSARDALHFLVDRERSKRDLMKAEANVYENRVRVRDLKRRLEEKDGDDELLIPRERRKRRRPEDAAPSSMMGSLGASTSAFKTTIRLPGRDMAANAPPPMPPRFTEPLNAFKDRTQTVAGRIERDIERKRAADREWEDYTDGAYCPLPFGSGARLFRVPDIGSSSSAEGTSHSRPATFAFSQSILHTLGGIRPAYRKRVGRGGRIFLDRIAAEDPQQRKSRLDSLPSELRERWMHDGDVLDEVLPSGPVVVDDYALPHVLHRLELLRKGDMQSLFAPSAWTEQSTAFLLQEPELQPPPQVIGKLPGRQSASTMPPHMALPGGALNAAQAPVHPGSAQHQAHLVSQMIMAANQQVAQSQSALRRIGTLPPNAPPMPNPQAPPLGLNGVNARHHANGVLGGSINAGSAGAMGSALPAQQQHRPEPGQLGSLGSPMLQQLPPTSMANGTHFGLNGLITAASPRQAVNGRPPPPPPGYAGAAASSPSRPKRLAAASMVNGAM